MTLKKTLDDMADTIRKKVAEKDTSLQESIDAFKALTAYYAVQQKTRKKQDDDEPESEGFNFANGIGEGQHGATPQVRTRRSS